MPKTHEHNPGEIPTPDEARELAEELGLDDLSDKGAELYQIILAKITKSGGKVVDFTIDDWANRWSSGLQQTDFQILTRALNSRKWAFVRQYHTGGNDRSGVAEPNYYAFKVTPFPTPSEA